MTALISPHGHHSLKCCTPAKAQREALKQKANEYTPLVLSGVELGDVRLLGCGAYTPLSGFMDEKDFQACCDDMRLDNGVFWPMPITLSIDEATAKQLTLGQTVRLMHPAREEAVALLNINDIYPVDKTQAIQAIFGTDDVRHPGIVNYLAKGNTQIGGEVTVLIPFESDNEVNFPVTPLATRDLITQKGWQRIAALQMRNPMHRAHEYLAKVALEICDAVLIHSVLGALKPGDIPNDVSIQAIDALLAQYFPKENVLHGGYPIAMRYAGPKEALLHAVVRQNYGCTDLIIGRDHAGVGDYYGHYDAHAIFDILPKDALKIKPLRLFKSVWCTVCKSMVTQRTCPHHPRKTMPISGSLLRKRLLNNEAINQEFSRPEVLEILQAYYQSLDSNELSTLRSVHHG